MIPGIHPTAAIGGFAQWREYLGEDDLETYEIFRRTGEYAPRIDPTARVGPFTQIDAGCIRATVIGPRTHVMGHCHVGHGVQIGADCDVASGTVIAGEVTVGDRVRIGVGAVIIPYRKIGDGARIGAGAVVIRDVPAGEVWAGNPARRLKPGV